MQVVDREELQKFLIQVQADGYYEPVSYTHLDVYKRQLCDLLRGGAASLPRRRISGRFWADFRGLLRLCGGRKQRQDKGLASEPTLRPVTSARSAGS